MNRNYLSLGLAAAAMLAAPLAFAQDATTGDQQQTPPPTTQSTMGDQAPATDAKQISWSELDADKDGALSKTEAAPVDSLSQAFDSADTDKDGSLTADEYKAYLATRQQDPAPGTQP
jgi:hypothetical protein